MATQPSLEEFRALGGRGNLIPVTRTLLGDFETPLSVYSKIRGAGESFLFESVEGGEHVGRYSFVGCRPRMIIRQDGGEVVVRERGGEVERFDVRPGQRGTGTGATVGDGLEVVERVLGRFQPVARPGLPRFAGGAVGFIGYEFIHDVEPVVPRPPKDELGTPTMYFLVADQVIAFDRVAQTMTVVVNAHIEPGGDTDAAYHAACAKLDDLVELIARPAAAAPVELSGTPPEVAFRSNQRPEDFHANVERAKRYITAGDIFQVVGSQRFTADIAADPVAVYRAARTVNPSPYMFLLELEGMALVGASPELHVRCEERRVEIRPIAGTRKRGATPEEDIELERELLADPKERAEHVMLVDLARNDLGRVCDYGSVVVKDLMVIERYSHVMHIVSQVEGKLSGGRTAYDLMRATFPAGTLSGAPKIRAMQIISELEQTTRGPYGGCVGYFGFNGNLDSCITIRTALLKDGKAHVQAGGGWVTDSTAEGEFQETVNKSRAMIKAISLAATFPSR